MNSKRKLSCCLPVCKGERFDLAHKFPRDPERVALWLRALDYSKLNDIPIQKLGYVCCRHFRVEDYKHPLSRSINKTAIPSLNLKDLSQLHLSKDPAPPLQQQTCAQVPLEKDSLFRPESIIEADEKAVFPKEYVKEPKILEQTNVLSSQQHYNEVEQENFEEADCGIIDERLSDISFINEEEDDHTEETNYPTVFEISHPNYPNSVSLNSFWLRCHCQCPMCYDSVKHQRKLSPLDVPERIQPKSVKQIDGLDVLQIEWDNGHKSEFNVNFLFSLENPRQRMLLRKPWDSHSPDIRGFFPTEFERIISSDKDCAGMFQSLREIGVAVVSSIPVHGQSMATLALCRLFPHLGTEAINFLQFKDTHHSISSNVSYSSVDCGLRCYFVEQNAELNLVDGLNVATAVSTLYPDALTPLCEVQVPLDISDNHVKYETRAPIIDLDADKQEIIKICLDVYKIGVLNTLSQDKVEGFYRSLRLMVRQVMDEDNHWTLKLKSGSMVLLDNNRILHKCPQISGIWEAHIRQKDYLSRMQHFCAI